MNLSYALAGGIPLLVGTENAYLVGVSLPSGDEYTLEPEDVTGAVSVDPAAVFWGLDLRWAEQRVRRAAEARRPPSYAPRGQLFTPLSSDDPSTPVTGFPDATLLRHRTQVPSVDVVRLSSLFAVSTVRTSIEQAEKSFNCFVDLYERAGRQLPAVGDIKQCFRGLQNTKSRMFAEVAGYAPTIVDAVASGLKDRELRRYLVRETDLPVGLGISKTSFTLALLGHDCVCLDARLLGRMFGSASKAYDVESGWGKTGKRLSELSLKRYEKVEDAFLKGNPLYDPRDPIGRARAQWMSWESVGGQAATHSVWLNVVG